MTSFKGLERNWILLGISCGFKLLSQNKKLRGDLLLDTSCNTKPWMILLTRFPFLSPSFWPAYLSLTTFISFLLFTCIFFLWYFPALLPPNTFPLLLQFLISPSWTWMFPPYKNFHSLPTQIPSTILTMHSLCTISIFYTRFYPVNSTVF